MKVKLNIDKTEVQLTSEARKIRIAGRKLDYVDLGSKINKKDTSEADV